MKQLQNHMKKLKALNNEWTKQFPLVTIQELTTYTENKNQFIKKLCSLKEQVDKNRRVFKVRQLMIAVLGIVLWLFLFRHIGKIAANIMN